MDVFSLRLTASFLAALAASGAAAEAGELRLLGLAAGRGIIASGRRRGETCRLLWLSERTPQRSFQPSCRFQTA